MPSLSILSNSLHGLVPTAFNEETDQLDVHREEPVDDFWVKETRGYDLSKYAEELPLCEDLEPATVGNGDSCWSTCHGQCPNDVLKPGLAFDFDEIRPGHPGCTSHFECVGNFDRVLCHGVRALEDHVPENFSAAERQLEDRIPGSLAILVGSQDHLHRCIARRKQRCRGFL
mmetsp:Transcript_43742/g.69540  ORF Transcript_43742/g.69540 Transcript_43742/m.69540 type:complete len:172 (+) Transcript_43742:22-537(+)